LAEEEADDPWSARDPWTYILLKPSSRNSSAASLFALEIERLPSSMGASKKEEAGDEGKSRWRRAVKKVLCFCQARRLHLVVASKLEWGTDVPQGQLRAPRYQA
jgi:hypothetical protein